ncbi:MAG: ribbon-helix-helix protein, CopG family [Chloroflexota bacterium]|nr:ribbon-helix-helix protein, CopG family [Chloroflexota bacterium]
MKLAPGEAGNARTVAARIPQSIERALVERARSTGARRSEVIRAALAAYLAPSS